MDFDNIPSKYNFIVYDDLPNYAGCVSVFHTGINEIIAGKFPAKYYRPVSYMHTSSWSLRHHVVTTFRFAKLCPDSLVLDWESLAALPTGQQPNEFLCRTNKIDVSRSYPVELDSILMKIICKNEHDAEMHFAKKACITDTFGLFDDAANSDEHWEYVLNYEPNSITKPISFRIFKYIVSVKPDVIRMLFPYHLPEQWTTHLHRNNIMQLVHKDGYVVSHECTTESELRLLVRYPLLFDALQTNNVDILMKLLEYNPKYASLIKPNHITQEMLDMPIRNTDFVSNMTPEVLRNNVVLLEDYIRRTHICSIRHNRHIHDARPFLADKMHQYVQEMDEITPIFTCVSTGKSYTTFMNCISTFRHYVLKYLSPELYNATHAKHEKTILKIGQPTPYHKLCHEIVTNYPECWMYIVDIPTYQTHYVLSLWQMCAYVANTHVSVVYFVQSIQM